MYFNNKMGEKMLENIEKFAKELDELGVPDISLGALQLWVHSRQIPDAHDHFNRNWVNATAYCITKDGMARISRGFLHLEEIESWGKASEKLYHTMSGCVSLPCIEQDLSVEMTMTSTGRLNVKIEFRAEKQEHYFEYDIDQSYLPNMFNGCKKVLDRFPI